MSSIISLKDEAEKAIERIKEYQALLFEGDDEELSINSKISQLQSSSQEAYEEIRAYKLRLIDGTEDTASILSQIETARSKIESNTTESDTLLFEEKEKLKSLNSFYDKVFGSTKEDGSIVKGLDDELDSGLKRITEVEAEHGRKYEAFEREIEGLLPGATTAGLATSYSTMKNSFDEPIKQLSLLFYFSLTSLFFLSVGALIEEIGFWYIRFPSDPTWSDLASNILIKAPLSVPFIWLAIFASRRRAENKRLQQEYAHKETVTMSYQGFRKQASELPDGTGEPLLAKLLEEAIESVGHNPSVTLDGNPSDDFPGRAKMM